MNRAEKLDKLFEEIPTKEKMLIKRASGFSSEASTVLQSAMTSGYEWGSVNVDRMLNEAYRLLTLALRDIKTLMEI